MSKPNTVKKTVTGAGTKEAVGRAAGVKTTGTVVITALSTNAGLVQIGGSQMNGTTIPGYPLAANASLRLDKGDVDDLADLYVYAANAGEGVTVFYTTKD